jgi:endonuclease YncB( thermonuclease family)
MKSIAGISGTLLFAALLAPPNGIAAELTGRAVGVHDGDTITVLDANKTQRKIRLAGIDAPELKQAFGNRAKKNLAELAFDKDARPIE